MKKLIVLSFCLWTSIVHAQNPLEKEIKTQVSAVTVFTEGAQETRKKNVDLPQGTTILKFTELSPFIDAKSIQIKATGSVMVLSVNHQLNHLQQMEKSKELEALDNKLTVLDENIKLENTLLSIIAEELAFLQTNRNIGGKNQEVSVSNLKSAADYYHEQLTRLKLKEIEGNKTLEKLSGERNNIQRQISSISGKKEFPKGEILVKVDAKTAIKADFEQIGRAHV